MLIKKPLEPILNQKYLRKDETSDILDTFDAPMINVSAVNPIGQTGDKITLIGKMFDDEIEGRNIDFYNGSTYLGTGKTNKYGVGVFDYTCSGAGKKEITGKWGSLVSEPYPVIDAMFYDSAILNDPQLNDTYYAFRSSYERFSDGTLISPTTTNAGYLMIDETGDTKPFNEELCFECDIVTSSTATNTNMMYLVGTNNFTMPIPNTTTGYHLKLEVKTNGTFLTIDDGTPTQYSAITGNYDIRFYVQPTTHNGSIKFKNAVLYPI